MPWPRNLFLYLPVERISWGSSALVSVLIKQPLFSDEVIDHLSFRKGLVKNRIVNQLVSFRLGKAFEILPRSRRETFRGLKSGLNGSEV